MQKPNLIVGIGSPHGDDQAAWRAVEQVATRVDRDDVAIRLAKSPLDLLAWDSGVTRLILCDACLGAGDPGQLHRWQWPSEALEQFNWSGTHDFPLPAVLKLAERLGRLPGDVVIWGIEIERVRRMEPISEEVASALPRLVDELLRELNHRVSPRQAAPPTKGSSCTNIRS